MLMRNNRLPSRSKIDKSWLEIDKKSGLVKYSEEMKSAWIHGRAILSISNLLKKDNQVNPHSIYSYPFYDGQSKGEYNAMVKAASLPKYIMSIDEILSANSENNKPKKYRANYYDALKKVLLNSPELKNYLERLDAKTNHKLKLQQSSDIFYREKGEDIEQNKIYLKKHPHQVGEKVIIFSTYGNKMSNPKIDHIESISKKGNVFLSKDYGANYFSKCFYPSGKHYHEPGGQLWFIPFGRISDLTWLCEAEQKNLYLKDWEEYEL